MFRLDQTGAYGRKYRAGRTAPVLFSSTDFSSQPFLLAAMAETLNQDVTNLTKWLRGAWRYLADPSLTSFDRCEIRNCMKDAEVALAAGLRRMADREKARRREPRKWCSAAGTWIFAFSNSIREMPNEPRSEPLAVSSPRTSV